MFSGRWNLRRINTKILPIESQVLLETSLRKKEMHLFLLVYTLENKVQLVNALSCRVSCEISWDIVENHEVKNLNNGNWRKPLFIFRKALYVRGTCAKWNKVPNKSNSLLCDEILTTKQTQNKNNRRIIPFTTCKREHQTA